MGVTIHGTMGRYVMVPLEFLSNPVNPSNERGMFATLLGLPPYWEFSIRGLTKIFPEGKGSLNRMLSGLQRKGYVKLVQNRDPNGHFGGTELIIELNPTNYQPDPHRQAENRDPAKRDPGIWYPASWAPTVRGPQESPESNIKESIIKESYITPESRAREPGLEKPSQEPEKGSGTEESVPSDRLLYVGEPRQVPSKNRFNNFKQRQYNFDYLEKQLYQAQEQSSEAGEQPASFDGQK